MLHVGIIKFLGDEVYNKALTELLKMWLLTRLRWTEFLSECGLLGCGGPAKQRQFFSEVEDPSILKKLEKIKEVKGLTNVRWVFAKLKGRKYGCWRGKKSPLPAVAEPQWIRREQLPPQFF